jgi:amino acid adenylation domain-containing protein
MIKSSLPQDTNDNLEIAVTGIDCLLPQAENCALLWDKLCQGINLISHFESQTTSFMKDNETHEVAAKGYLPETEYFDAEFFNINSKLAEIMCPQHRILLQVAYRALEDSGIKPSNKSQPVGVFVSGNATPLYLIHHLMPSTHILSHFGLQALTVYNQIDALATTLSYRLNLTGPSLTIQTACSSSLAAIIQAVNSLRRGECAVALAGGVNITLPLKTGYLYEPGSINSSDGVCRPFSQLANGIVPADGAGIVVLKPLKSALRDKDSIYAIIKGVGLNNDGQNKSGFIAPSIDGQTRVIKAALKDANIAASEVGYVEAHGTGTILGDRIELAALKQVFQQDSRKHPARLGSIKSNLGHCNTAAGVIGFIKTCLTLHHRTLPMSLHSDKPNSDLKASAAWLQLQQITEYWQSESPRVAGVSAFGVGGTNAHVIISEPSDDCCPHPFNSLHEFKKTRCWVSQPPSSAETAHEPLSLSWLHTIALKPSTLNVASADKHNKLCCIVADIEYVNDIEEAFEKLQMSYILITPGEILKHHRNHLSGDFTNENFWTQTQRYIKGIGIHPTNIIVLVSEAEADQQANLESHWSRLLMTLRHILNCFTTAPLSLLFNQSEYQQTYPAIVMCLRQEYPRSQAQYIQWDSPHLNDGIRYACTEQSYNSRSHAVFYQAQQRYEYQFTSCPDFPMNVLWKWPLDATYLITGGLGNMAMTLMANILHQEPSSQFVLVNRHYQQKSDLPLDISQKLRHFLGHELSQIILMRTDVSHLKNMMHIAKQLSCLKIKIHATFHLAGAPGHHRNQSLNHIEKSELRQHLATKVLGLSNLAKLNDILNVPHCIVMSSLAALLGGHGLIAYALSNAKMNEACCHLNQKTSNTHYRCILWDNWCYDTSVTTHDFIAPKTGFSLLEKFLSQQGINEIAVSVTGLQARLSSLITRFSTPHLNVEADNTSDNVDMHLKAVWQDTLGLEAVDDKAQFFDLGGDSFTAIIVAEALSQRLAFRVSSFDILEYNRYDKLRDYLKQQQLIIQKQHPEKEEILPIKARPITLPLAKQQRRIWLQELRSPNTALNNMPYGFMIEGDLDIPGLEKAMNILIQRHDTLRMAVQTDEQQCLYPHSQLTLEMIIRPIDVEEEKYIETIVAHELETPISLIAPPLCRARLYALSHERYVLMFIIHHIVTDGFSMAMLFRELSTTYTALLQGKDNPLPPLPYNYATLCQEQNQPHQSMKHLTSLKFWREHLLNAPPLWSLPTDFPRRSTIRYKGAMKQHRLSPAHSKILIQRAKEANVSLFCYLFAFYQFFLHRYTQQDIIVVGTPIQQRDNQKTQQLFGFMVNTLPVAMDFSENLKYDVYVQQMHQQLIQVYKHQDIYFDEIIEHIKPPRSSEHDPLFQTAFALQTSSHAELSLKGCLCESLHHKAIEQQRMSRTEVYFVAELEDGILTFIFEYLIELFKPSTIDTMMQQWWHLMQQIIERPHDNFSDYSLLGYTPTHPYLSLDNVQNHETIMSYLTRHAQQSPTVCAIKHHGKTLTYAELDRISDTICVQLRKLTMDEPCIIPMVASSSLPSFICLFSILKAGCAYLPLDPQWPMQRLKQAMTEVKATVALYDEAVFSDVSDLPCETWLSFAALMRPSTNGINKPLSIEPHLLAYVIYTSGSSGIPKAIPIRHDSLLNLAKAQSKCFDVISNDNIIQFAPLTFDASVSEWAVSLYAGATLCLVDQKEKLDVDQLATAIQKNHITIATFPPSYLQELPPQKMHGLKTLVSAGEPCKRILIERYANTCRFINAYGPTETAVCASIHICSQGSAENNVGQAIEHTRLMVLDKYNQPLPQGHTGEITIAGIGLSPGYLNPSETTGFFQLHNISLYRTGDLGYLDESECLRYLGRQDRQVKSRGYRIDLQEIETYLKASNDVKEAAVVQSSNHQIIGFVVLEPVSSHTNISLRTTLATYMPSYLLPHRVQFLPHLPHTAHGKIDYQTLQKLINDINSSLEHTTISNAKDNPFYALCARILQQHNILPQSNFFEMGGDSIGAIRLVNECKQIGLHLTPGLVFECPDFQTLLGHATTTNSKPSVMAQNVTAHSIPLLPIQQWFFSQSFKDPHYWNQSCVLRFDEPLNEQTIRHTLNDISKAHCSLRVTFLKQSEGWQQIIHTQPQYYYTSTMIEHHQQNALQIQLCNMLQEIQKSLNITEGPLMAVTHVQADAHYLILVIHHLVTDVVSWHIIVDQLSQRLSSNCSSLTTFDSDDQAYTHACQNPPTLYKMDEDILENSTPPSMFFEKSGSEASAMKQSRQLDTSLLRSLGTMLIAQTGLDLEAMFVTILHYALSDTLQTQCHLIHLEHHGRDLYDADINQCTGWFTSLLPVLLQQQGQPHVLYDIFRTAKAIKNASSILAPDNSKHPALILFNYLGKLSLQPSARVTVLPIENSVDRSPDNHRCYAIECNLFYIDDSLTMQWVYSENGPCSSFCQKLIRAFEHHYITVVQKLHCILQNWVGQRLQACGPMHIMMLQQLEYSQQSLSQQDLYLVQTTLKIPASLSSQQVLDTWQGLSQRHPILRAEFPSSLENYGIMVIRSRIEITLVCEDCHTDTMASALEQLEYTGEQERRKRVDIEQAPVFRLYMMNLPNGNSVLRLTHHHILLDGWSAHVLMQEFLETYHRYEGRAKEALVNVESSSLVISFYDALKAQRFWHTTLSNLEEIQSLTSRYSHLASTQNESILCSTITLTKHLKSSIQRFCRLNGITENSLFLTAWGLLQSVYLHQRQVIFATVHSGRNKNQGSNLNAVGCFIETIPIFMRLQPSSTPLILCNALQQFIIKAQNHSGLTLSEIISCQPQLDIASLLQVLFVYENYPRDGQNIDDTSLSIDSISSREKTDFPLMIMGKHIEQIQFEFHYQSQYFTSSFVKQLMDHYQEAITYIVENSEQPIQKFKLHAGVKQTTPKPAHEQNLNIGTVFWESAQRFPEKIAIRCFNSTITYHELFHRSHTMASELKKIMVGTIALCLDSPLDMITAMLSCILAGKIYVPLDLQNTFHENKALLNLIGNPPVCVNAQNTADYNDNFSPIIFESLLQSTDSKKISTQHELHPDCACILFTSGTTGTRKAVAISHSNIIHLAQNPDLKLLTTDVMAQASNLTFDASLFEIWGALLNGLSLVLISKDILLLPDLLKHRLESTKTNVMWCTSSVFNRIIRIAPDTFHNIRRLFVGGEALNKYYINACLTGATRDMRLVNGYGPTECTTFSSFYELTESKYEGDIPIGTPLQGTKIQCLDINGNPVPPPLIGELCISGSGVALGYVHEKVLKTYNPVFCTGDMGYVDDGGKFHYSGRKDRRFKRHGFRIDSNIIERAITSLSSIQSCRVEWVQRNPEPWLCAFVTTENKLDITSIRSQLTSVLPTYLIPDKILACDILPVTMQGKLDVVKAVEQMPEREKMKHANLSPTQASWLALIEETLGVVVNDLQSTLLNYGCHSLDLMTLRHVCQQRLGLPMSLLQFRTDITFEALLNAIQSFHTTLDDHCFTPVMPNQGSSEVYVFFYPGDGFSHCYLPLIDLLPKIDAYVTTAPELLMDKHFIPSLEALAEFYVHRIMTKLSSKRLHLIGWSFGGVLAYEVARQLHEKDISIKSILMLDSVNFASAALDCKSILEQNMKIIRSKLATRTSFASLRRIESVLSHHLNLLKQYIPKPLRHQVHLVKAMKHKETFYIEDQYNGWSELCDIKVTLLSCEHSEMLNTTYLNKMVEIIQNHTKIGANRRA